MARRKKAKRGRRTSPKRAKAPAKRAKSGRNATTRAAAKAKSKKRSPPRAKAAASKQAKRAAPRKQRKAKTAKPLRPVETVIVDTIEEPVPGMVVVTEYEAVVQRPKPTED